VTVLTLQLHRHQPNQLITFMKELGMPIGLRQLGFNDEEIINTLKHARNIRKRFTVIDTITIDKNLLKQIDTL
jgi:glycerol dehydrogenase-like iron-containing ADH family enzyme